MKTMGVTEFKLNCLKVVDRVRTTREPVMITKRGKPVAKLVPVGSRRGGVFGGLKGVVEIVGDIESPAVAPEDWEAYRRFRWRHPAPQPSKLASFPRRRKSSGGK
jgi:prevent-host-death family protein